MTCLLMRWCQLWKQLKPDSMQRLKRNVKGSWIRRKELSHNSKWTIKWYFFRHFFNSEEVNQKMALMQEQKNKYSHSILSFIYLIQLKLSGNKFWLFHHNFVVIRNVWNKLAGSLISFGPFNWCSSYQFLMFEFDWFYLWCGKNLKFLSIYSNLSRRKKVT